jgi:oxaloacetate decarboxylase gamma subunit
MQSETTLILEAINLTLFGMGFVFAFLTLLVFVTKLMSVVIQKTQPKIATQTNAVHADFQIVEIDEEAKFVIEQAIRMHRGA